MWHLKGYVQNLIWCNEALDDDIRLEGVMQTEEGVSLVISQPYIIGREPTDAEMVAWFTLQGCKRVAKLKWEYPDGLIVADAYTRNFILMQDGNLVPIDLHVERLGSS